MQRHTVAPAVGQRGDLLVRPDDPADIDPTEQRQHRQVGLAVAAVRRRIDEPRVAAHVDVDVAGPEVAVHACRSLGRARDLVDAIGERVDGTQRRRRELATVDRNRRQRSDTTLDPELAPRGRRLVGHGERREIGVRRCKGRPAELHRAGQVELREPTPELIVGVGVASTRLDPFEREEVLADGQYVGHAECACGTQPSKAGGFGLEEPGWCRAVELREHRAAVIEVEPSGLGDAASVHGRRPADGAAERCSQLLDGCAGGR